MLCSPMMIPPHPPRRRDPLWANLDLVRISRNHVLISPAQEPKKNATPLVGVLSVWGAENFKIVYLSKTSLVPKILVPPTPR